MLGMWKSPVQAFVLGVTLSICLDSASAIKIEVIPANPQVGQKVIFNVTEISGEIRFATWYKGQSTDAKDQILNFFPPETEHKGDQYFPEAKGLVNGSLVITKASETFNGYYTVQIQTKVSLTQRSVNLTVNGVIRLALSPLVPLLGLLLLSELNFL